MTEIVEFVNEVCGIYFRSILLEKQGDKVTQHVHDYDHATYIGAGSVRLWREGVYDGDHFAGTAIPIFAGQRHLFEALAPQTRLTCVHDATSAESIKAKGL